MSGRLYGRMCAPPLAFCLTAQVCYSDRGVEVLSACPLEGSRAFVILRAEGLFCLDPLQGEYRIVQREAD